MFIKANNKPGKSYFSGAFYTKKVQTKAKRDESKSSITQVFENETGQKVHKSDFFLCETHPLLGASPDGVINDNKIVEAVKRVVLREGGSLDDGTCRLGIYKKLTRKMAVN